MADGGEGAPLGAKTPADFLKSIKGKPVIVKLNSGVDYRGARPRRVQREPTWLPTPARPPPGAPRCLNAAAIACAPSLLPLQACWLAWMVT